MYYTAYYIMIDTLYSQALKVQKCTGIYSQAVKHIVKKEDICYLCFGFNFGSSIWHNIIMFDRLVEKQR